MQQDSIVLMESLNSFVLQDFHVHLAPPFQLLVVLALIALPAQTHLKLVQRVIIVQLPHYKLIAHQETTVYQLQLLQ